MVEKDKLSKEVEEQIQSIASDVYIQIEEKLTQLVSTAVPKHTEKSVNVEQAPDYIALQKNYQASQQELTTKSKRFTEQITTLEQSVANLKKQLSDEQQKKAAEAAKSKADLKAQDSDLAKKIEHLAQENNEIKSQLASAKDKQQVSEQNFQVELTQNNINFTETIERLEHENSLIKAMLTKEQSKLSSEQKNSKSALSEQTKQLHKTIETLEKSLSTQKTQFTKEQTRFNEHDKKQKTQLSNNEKELKQQQQQIVTLNEKLSTLVKQEDAQAKALAANFVKNKGKLPWPVTNGLIVRKYGSQPHPTLRGIRITSTGLHIATDKGATANSVFNGKVLAIQVLTGGKKAVLVQHGNYITTYNNIETLYVKEGDAIITGQALGKIFTNKVTQKTILIFALHKETQRQNPAYWILNR